MQSHSQLQYIHSLCNISIKTFCSYLKYKMFFHAVEEKKHYLKMQSTFVCAVVDAKEFLISPTSYSLVNILKRCVLCIYFFCLSDLMLFGFICIHFVVDFYAPLRFFFPGVSFTYFSRNLLLYFCFFVFLWCDCFFISVDRSVIWPALSYLPFKSLFLYFWKNSVNNPLQDLSCPP